jgi:serine O-acetyltransferase
MQHERVGEPGDIAEIASPARGGILKNLRRDAARYETIKGGWRRNGGFWIVSIYRFGTWASTLRNPLLRWPTWALYRVLKILYPGHNVHLWAGAHGARIGAGFCLIHPANVMIGPGVQIGEDCLMFHGVTIGMGPLPGLPRIGNRVDVYAGACILGGVVIGDDVMIGANCVVTRDVPSGSIVSAAPTKVLPRSLSPVAQLADGMRAQVR